MSLLTVSSEVERWAANNIGLLNSGINLAFSDSATNGSGDGDILISLKANHHPTIGYTRQLRTNLATRFPSEIFFFQAADITSQILNFGMPAPIDVQVTGNDAAANYRIAAQLRTDIADCREPWIHSSGNRSTIRP